MGANTKIEWADDTFNGWWGCTEISDACDHCYARELATRFGKDLWGNKDRELKSDANWAQPLKWQRDADRFEAEHGRKRFVFTASMSDVFDNQVDSAWRARLWDLIRQCDRLIWLILTKRPQNIAKMLPPDWGTGWPHVWLGTTVEHQEAARRNIPPLLQVPASKRFLSCEPLLGPIDLRCIDINGDGELDALHSITWGEEIDAGWRDTDPDWEDSFLDWYSLSAMPDLNALMYRPIDWIIAGGESGPNARPSHPDWFRSLRDQCAAAGVPFLFKQWGEWTPSHDEALAPGTLVRLGKKLAGRQLDGVTHDWRPEA